MDVFICVAVTEDGGSNSPRQNIIAAHTDYERAVTALMEYFDEYEPHISNEDRDTILTNQEGTFGKIVTLELDGGTTNGF